MFKTYSDNKKIEFIMLDQAKNPNNKTQPNYNLNSIKTWAKLEGTTEWKCLRSSNNIYDISLTSIEAWNKAKFY